ncbi:MAG TPA: hypothetical protein VN903_39810 [Polyangia bacterium]|jgi:hypothetical protein|nr:hypothetical protein [Polyangia bacterium]
MRILCLVLLSIVVVVGALLGGACAWSATMGPLKEKRTQLEETAAATKEIGKLTGDLALVEGKSANQAGALLQQGVRGYRVLQFGGGAIALINLALLVFAAGRRSKQILLVGGIGTAIGVACIVLAPARRLDETLHSMILAIAISVIASALFAWLADRAGGARTAAAPVPVR